MAQVYLVGVDCSDCCNRALEYASEKAAAHGIKLVIAHVIEWSPYSFNTNEENAERHRRREAELERAHKEIVDPEVEKLRQKGINAEGVIRHGHIARTLKSLAGEHDASTIIVGRHGESGVLTQFFGSVPGALIQIADRPVTVVP
jgi:nucleotide-binding universal stress UspA family protein